MIPASVLLRQFEGLTIERNFDAEPLGKANLFERAVGQTVTLTRTDKASGIVRQVRAKIVSASNGVVFDIGGKFETYQCSGLSEGTLFENLPDGLNNVPELSIDVETQTAGPQEVVISYLADNFSWEADYRLDLVGDEKTAHLAGWITLNNMTSQSFKNTPLAIIAGRLNRSTQTRAPNFMSKTLRANCWPNQSTQTPVALREYLYDERDRNRSMSNAPVYRAEAEFFDGDQVIVTASRIKTDGFTSKRRDVEQEDFGDYKLYRISEPVTVSAYQTKQIRFLNIDAAPYKKIHTLDVVLNPNYVNGIGGLDETSIEYRLNNDRDGKIAKALPKGTMRLFAKNDNGHRLVIGETDVRDTAVDNPMKIYLDKSFLVQVYTTSTKRTFKTMGKKGTGIDMNMTHKITNATDVPAWVEINIPRAYPSLKIRYPSHKQDPKVGPNGWTIVVPPNDTVTLKYKALYIQ
ncbi:MAG: hypothetical protein L3J05_09980, partial [Robiginitomaculum sp.]|nr:hypothetical protein [Robiginitomaculum sp.]